MAKIKIDYSSPQEILYTVCLAAWNLCSQYLQNFTNLKAFYTAAIIADALEAVQAAKQLPDSRQTIAARKVARINLANGTRQVLVNWQLLKVYITDAFDKDLVPAKLEEAGASLYSNASDGNWSAVRSLIETGNSFIAANIDELTSGENMPAAFQVTYQSAGVDCIELSEIFAQADLAKELATSIKIAANNAIYARLMEMLKDGQQIFKEDAALKRQFTFSYLKSLYQGVGSASLKGYVVNNLGQPVQGVTIISADQKYKATTNAKGYYRINRVAEGTYTFTATCPGYAPVEQVITFAAGTASKGDFEMINQMKKAA